MGYDYAYDNDGGFKKSLLSDPWFHLLSFSNLMPDSTLLFQTRLRA